VIADLMLVAVRSWTAKAAILIDLSLAQVGGIVAHLISGGVL